MSAADKPISFREHQFLFSAYIRDPKRNPMPPGVEKLRVDLYRELMFNNVENFLSSSFPVLKRILNETSWIAMVEGFFSSHRCQTPYFSEIPEEFLKYLQTERQSTEEDLPFLTELAHYEWLELALSLADEEEPAAGRRDLRADALDHRYRVSDVAWPLIYRFPVHQISQSFQPEQAPEQPTYLVVYRNPDEQIQFMEINALTYRFLEMLDTRPNQTANHCLIDLARTIIGLKRNKIVEYGCEILNTLWIRGIVYRNEA
ncbi:MAG: HvfC family RiPP maturation protein [Methylococcales bacterium]